MSIRIMSIVSITKLKEDDFEFDDNATWEYDKAEDFLWNDSHGYRCKPYTNNQISMFASIINVIYDTYTDDYNYTPGECNLSFNKIMSYYRIDYTPLNNLPYEDENNRIWQEIKNLPENNKQMTHEVNCLQD